MLCRSVCERVGSVAQFDRVEFVSTEHDQQEDRREDLESIVLLEVIVREALDELPRVAHVDDEAAA